MSDRYELVEAALDASEEGIALFDLEQRVSFWNRMAESITGYAGQDLLGRLIPGALEPLASCRCDEAPGLSVRPLPLRGTLVHARHRQGHDLPAMARTVVLRDGLGERIGSAAVFRPAEQVTALPHGETSEGTEVKRNQAEFEERLQMEFDAFLNTGNPLAVLWISVDQAHLLRKTHGARACEVMLECIERTVANGLEPGEEVGRWGDDEFLILSHEHGGEALAAHGQRLTGLARTAEFRWWGDRVSLTVSVGAAEADKNQTLADLLKRAQSAMQSCMRSGGNHISLASREQSCSPL